jgi:hypothetical protein
VVKKLRQLIATTGSNRIIENRWLPLIRTKGEYTGDILLLDYGVKMYPTNTPELSKKLSDSGVIVVPAELTYRNIFIDRMMKYREYLEGKWGKYDTVMLLDSNDVIVWGSMKPLWKVAKEKLCYVKEHPSNLLSIWNDFYPREFIQQEYMSVANNPIINDGMVVGPSQSIKDLLDYEKDMIQIYGDIPSDQTFFDLFIYFFKYPSQEVGYEWNYTHAVIGRENGYPVLPRIPTFKDGKAFAREDGREIIIEHRTGTGWKLWRSKEGMELLESNRDIPINAEYEIRIEGDNGHKPLFKNTTKIVRETYLFKNKVDVRGKPTYLFPR